MTTPPRPSALRRAVGIVRLAVGSLVAFSILFQVVDLSLHDALKPHEYFTFFTIQTCSIMAVVLILGGVSALRRPVDPLPLASLAAAVVPYAIVTGIVYNTLLRDLPAPGYRGPGWPNEVLHVVLPIVILLDWVLAPGRPRVPWREIGLTAAYPVLWIVATMIRGDLTAWYPYPFLDPGGPDGVLGVVIYIAVLTVAILLLGLLAILRTRARPRSVASRG